MTLAQLTRDVTRTVQAAFAAKAAEVFDRPYDSGDAQPLDSFAPAEQFSIGLHTGSGQLDRLAAVTAEYASLDPRVQHVVPQGDYVRDRLADLDREELDNGRR